MREILIRANLPNVLGYCQCGCGNMTIVSSRNDASKGWEKGRHRKYIRGHNAAENGRRQTERNIGSKSISSSGYVVVRVGKGLRKYEHVLMAEKILGRRLKFLGRGHPDNEEVHHINGVKTDNRHANFVICTRAYHRELHYKMERSADWPEFPRRATHPSCWI